MLTLIEKAQQDYDEKKAEELAQKMKENSFGLSMTFVEQIDQVMGMGPIEDLFEDDSRNESNGPGIENVKVDPKQNRASKSDGLFNDACRTGES